MYLKAQFRCQTSNPGSDQGSLPENTLATLDSYHDHPYFAMLVPVD